MPDMCLLEGDVLDVLATLEAESVHCVVTSPPYNVGLKRASWNDTRTDDEFREWTAAWLAALYRVCADNARIYVVVSDKMLWWLRGAAEPAGWKFVQMMPWCKTNMVGANYARISADWNILVEWVFLFRKGKRTPMLNSEEVTTFNWFAISTPQSQFKGDKRKVHPAQFPVELAYRLLARTPGSVVLDPFCGSGSALVAARKLGRMSIGIDENPEYLEIARVRMEGAQPPLAEA